MSGESSKLSFERSAPRGAVFLSYASQDAEAAKRICDALRSGGVEVWFDADGGLEHGDEWDAKIRRQIKECVLFLPLISANTQARLEGYFRIEWELAAQRAMGIASGVAFILPVVIDDTREPDALVPDRFRAVQWTKLRGGIVPPDVLQRFLKLWSHRTGALKYRSEEQGAGSREQAEKMEAGRPRPAQRGEGTAPPIEKRPRWLAPVLAGFLVLAIALGVTWKMKFAGSIRAAAAPPTAPVVPERLSPARQLVERARPLIDKGDLIRVELDTAQSLLEQAAKLDPNDSEVWAEWAVLDARYLSTYFDHSAARKAAAQAHVGRALGLDAGSRDARFARAVTLPAVSEWSASASAEAAEILRVLVAENSRDAEALLALAGTVKELDEALALLDRAGRLPGMTGKVEFGRMLLYYYAGRYAEADRAAGASLASERSWAALSWKAYLALVWRGDLAAAARLEAEVPTSWRLESLGAMINVFVYSYRREPEKALEVMRLLPEDEVHSNFYSGSKRVVVGDLLAMAGRPEAARIEWGAVWKASEQEVASAPADEANAQGVIEGKIFLLDRLGERAEAERLWRLDLDLYGGDLVKDSRLHLMVRMEPPEHAIEVLEGLLRGPFSWRIPTAAMLRYDPMYDPLRKSPRFAKLLALAEADPRLSPPATTEVRAEAKP